MDIAVGAALVAIVVAVGIMAVSVATVIVAGLTDIDENRGSCEDDAFISQDKGINQ